MEALDALLASLGAAFAWLSALHPALLVAALALISYAAYRAFSFLSHLVSCAVLFALLPLAASWLGLSAWPSLSAVIASATFGVVFFIVYSAVLGELKFLSWLLSPLHKKPKPAPKANPA